MGRGWGATEVQDRSTPTPGEVRYANVAAPSHHFVGGSTAARPLLKLTSDATDYRLVVDDRVTV
jgi:hypothetical protein